MVMATMSFAECLPFPLDESSFVSVVFVCCVTLHIIMNTKILRFDTSKFFLIMTSFICFNYFFEREIRSAKSYIRRVRVSFSRALFKLSANEFTQQQQQPQTILLFRCLYLSHLLNHSLPLLYTNVERSEGKRIF